MKFTDEALRVAAELSAKYIHDKHLPDKGSVIDRFQKLANRFIIPKDKLDTVFKAAIAEARKAE